MKSVRSIFFYDKQGLKQVAYNSRCNTSQ